MAATELLVSEVLAPSYWADACKHLMKKDRVMKRLIPQFGQHCLQSRGDAFVTLARSVVGQQISVKAAQTVWDRFILLPKKLTPASVLRLKIDDMRAAGLSARKVEYIVDLALHFDNGAVHVDAWTEMDDEAIIDELVVIRGIGRWTAEMTILRGLHCPDTFPADDIGIRRLISQFYLGGRKISSSEARSFAGRWGVWKGFAAYYLEVASILGIHPRHDVQV